MSSFSEQKMHLLGKWRGDFQFLKTYFLSTLVVKYFMSQSVEWLRGAACKEVFTPLWLMRGYFPSCCPICCNPIIPSPLYRGAAVSCAWLTQPPPAKRPKMHSSAGEASHGFEPTQHISIFKHIWACIRPKMPTSISNSFTLCWKQRDACLKKSYMSLFEVPLRFDLNVTVRDLIKLSGAANILEICSSYLVSRHGFPLFDFELSRGCEGDFQVLEQKNETDFWNCRSLRPWDKQITAFLKEVKLLSFCMIMKS